jgi:hypothetical protein
MPSALPPVRKEVVVRCRRELAFEVFTARMAEWWPLASHSVGGPETRSVTVEPREGGRLYESRADGSEYLWGTVTRWDPPHGFDCTWHPGREPSTAQSLSLRFHSAGEGTRVELEHRGWEALAERAETTRSDYENGWDLVFGERFVAAAEVAART